MEDYLNMNARDRLAASEHEINAARAKREQQERDEARGVRSRLERASPSGARRSFVDMLNGMSHGQTASPNLDFLTKLRADQALNRRTAVRHNRSHEAFMKSEAFNRLSGTAGSRHDAPSGFNFDGRDPGQREPSRFGHEEPYAPTLRPGERVNDAAGRLVGDGRARPGETGDINDGSDHWSDGRVKPIDPEFLLEIARQIIEAVRSRTYSQRPV